MATSQFSPLAYLPDQGDEHYVLATPAPEYFFSPRQLTRFDLEAMNQ